MTFLTRTLGRALLAGSFALPAAYTAAADCSTVRLSDPGWTDINVTNAVTGHLLRGLGYQTHIDLLAVPIGFKSLSSNDIDVFLGNWMPAQQSFADEYDGGYDRVAANLTGAKFTLAVPRYVYDAGVTGFEDLAAHAEDFDRRIYGIDPGAPANNLIQSMIDDGDFGLQDWQLIDSSEQGMLSQVGRAVRRDDFIVFLGWEPHPMNLQYDLAYLSGGDDYFGPDYGGATVYTLTRQGYSQDCPNVGRLLKNLRFSLDMESRVMGRILDNQAQPDAAAGQWLKDHPQVWAGWLDGVRTLDGQPAVPAVQRYLRRL